MLQSLNHSLFFRTNCQFGGGTAMALLHGEYRESRDIDFLVNQKGFSELRAKLHSEGIASFFSKPLLVAREPRFDRDAIRTALALPTEPDFAVKFEIVLEGRIQLDAASRSRRLAGVPVLSQIDLVAEKLLANSDRWNDPTVFSRDLIDLAMSGEDMPSQALAKAEGAYRSTIRKDLDRARKALISNKGALKKCMDRMQIDVPEAALRDRIAKLSLPKPGEHEAAP